MSEEPQFPDLPDLGEIDRKDRFIQKKTSVIRCNQCKSKRERSFKVGDYTFKKLNDEECDKCHSKISTIEEIYAEWVDPKKSK